VSSQPSPIQELEEGHGGDDLPQHGSIDHLDPSALMRKLNLNESNLFRNNQVIVCADDKRMKVLWFIPTCISVTNLQGKQRSSMNIIYIAEDVMTLFISLDCLKELCCVSRAHNQ